MIRLNRVLLVISIIVFTVNSIAQNVGINTTGATPDASAMLDIVSSNKGLLIPRVALTATNSNAPIGNGIATGLLVYNTATTGTAPNDVVPGFYYWNAEGWVSLTGGDGGNNWSVTGKWGDYSRY